MKKQYLVSLPKPTDFKNEAYNAYLNSVQEIFASIQNHYQRQTCQYLLEEIKKLKDVKDMKKNSQKPIYEFFLKRQLQTLSYIRGQYSIDYQIMKLTKCKLQDFKIDWKDIWKRIISQVPESGSFCSKWIEHFIKHIKVFFDENNALQVWQYFQTQDFKQFSKMVQLFAKVTPKTQQKVFTQFINLLINSCKSQQITKNNFLTIFQWLKKSRKGQIKQQVFAFLNDVVLDYILGSNQKGSKKVTIQNNFSANEAQILQKALGKANSGSVQLVKIIFSFLKKFIKPLENSTKSVVFVYWFIKAVFQRVQNQKKGRQKLSKLIQKIQKKKAQQQDDNETKLQDKESVLQKKEKQTQNEDNDDEQSQQEEQIQDQQDEQINQILLLGKSSKISFQKDDQSNEKDDTDQEKRDKMEKLLKNELSQQILSAIQKQIDQVFQIIYYVNSKKTISHLLRYIYRLFPKFVIKSLDVLDKAINIPNISQDGLVKNLIVTVQHMFTTHNYKDGVKNIMRVLEKAFNSRRIVDVWYIYQGISSKVPLLDEKDLQNIPLQDKQLFQKNFELNHDRFYQQYSDHMLEAFKRLIKQGQYLQKTQYKSFSLTMEQIYRNSYQFMRKRILTLVLEVITQKPNSLALYYLAFSQLPPKQFEILKNHFISMNDQNRDTQQIRLQMLGVLSRNMSLQQLKPYVRKMAEKGHSRLIQDYQVYRSIQLILWKPYSTTLNYLYEDPKITIEFENSLEKRRECLKQLEVYRDQLLQQAAKQIDQIKQDEPDSIQNRIVKSYTNTVKVSTHLKRKKIHQILSIVAVINQMMEQKLIQIKNQKRLQLVDSGVKPYGFLDIKKPFAKYIKIMLNSQQILHDPKLVGVLNTLLTSEYFLYLDIELNEDKKLTKQKKKNKNHEATDYVNRITYGNQYIALARNYMALLLYKTNGGNNYDIRGMTQQLFILSMAHQNQTYKDLRSMFQESKLVPLFKQYLFKVMKIKKQNRDLIKRISSSIDFLTKKQNLLISYTDQQLLQFVLYHVTLSQSQDSKVKQNAIKSFRRFAALVNQHPISDNLTQSMIKYKHIDKLQIIWIIYVAALISHPDFLKQKQVSEKRIRFLIKNLQPLVLHELRSIRRTTLYIYPSLIRKLKKINTKHQTKIFQPVQYKQKQLSIFIQTGYLRPQFYDRDLKDKETHQTHPHDAYQAKIQYEIPFQFFDFLIENPENAIKFIKTFHSDLASTTEQMLSAMQSAMNTVDLFTIANKSIQKLIYFFKTKDMSISRSQLLVGAKFFKYLCIEDQKKGYKFFNTVKQFVLSCLSNMQSLDNQNLVILYAYSLTNVYQVTFKQRIPQVQDFLVKIFRQIIKKSSKIIYTKLQTLFFKKIKNRQAIKFIEQMCINMIQSNHKVFRAGYLLSLINNKKFSTTKEILSKILRQKIELEQQSNINSNLNLVLSYPQQNKWILKQIQKTNIIDLQKLLSQKKILPVFDRYIIFSNKQVQEFLIQNVRKLIQTESFQIIKTSFTILNNIIKCCSELYMTEQNQVFINQLLKIWLNILKEKKQLQLDFQSGYKAINNLFGSGLIKASAFQNFLTTVLQNIQPNKKSCDLLIQILNSPINFIKISDQLFEKFLRKMIQFESNSALYKQILQITSTLLRYRSYPFQKISQIQKQNKNKRAFLLQAYLLAQNAQLNPQIVKQVLKISSKERKNVWAREMKLIRGQRQYFDKPQTYQIWRQIKQLSNTYNYHA